MLTGQQIFDRLQKKPAKPPKEAKPIARKGKRTISYEKWRDDIAIPHLKATGKWFCTDCQRSDIDLDVDHIKGRGAHAELKMEITNVEARCRPCHRAKTSHGGV